MNDPLVTRGHLTFADATAGSRINSRPASAHHLLTVTVCVAKGFILGLLHNADERDTGAAKVSKGWVRQAAYPDSDDSAPIGSSPAAA